MNQGSNVDITIYKSSSAKGPIKKIEKSPLCPDGQIRPIRLEISDGPKMSKDLQPVLC